MTFVRDVKEIREHARRKMEEGAVTQDYALDRSLVIEVLNAALATEIVCVLRYRFHYFMATGIHSAAVAAEFLEHANEEQAHADQLARRIRQLGGKPEMNPATLHERSHSEYREGAAIAEMLREDLVAERIAIESYREMVTFFGDKDSTTRIILEGILAKEEEHAEEIADLLFTVEPQAGSLDGRPHRGR
ncbi:MAG: ferritin-like domain-containing protein [Planctomycetota bacterium]